MAASPVGRHSDAQPVDPIGKDVTLVARENDAAIGSLMLAREIDKLRARGLSDECREPRALTFEQQVAAVMAGARLVEVAPQRTAANQRVDRSVLL